MIKLSQKQQKILLLFLEKSLLSSSGVQTGLALAGEKISLITVKRALSELVNLDLLKTEGSGRSTVYAITSPGRMFADVNAKKYNTIEPDRRFGLQKYNFELFSTMPKNLFNDEELGTLNSATAEYHKRIQNLPAAIKKKELERLVIELSWKSSKIEGNTYTLLDTEKLILEHKEATGHSKKEALMILNHKDAFTFIHEHKNLFRSLTKRNLEQVHSLLIKNLNVGKGLRSKPVGVTGSAYRPLDNIYQIFEAVDSLGRVISKLKTPYAKALMVLLGISYIQPFEDGNKRTARLMANALLLAHSSAPLSYRSVEENEYREATLVFYELNSIVPFKKIFITQYDFAARNYAVK